MREPRLSSIDLNLLVALDALLREESVTAAGKRLGLSQPAMSQASWGAAIYGVRAEDFDVVGSSLLSVLADLDADHWTPALHAAWLASYQAISGAMLRGLAEGALTPRPRETT